MLTGQRGVTPVFGYGVLHPNARGTLTLLIWALPSTHYEPVRHPKRPSLLLTEFSLRATTSHRMGLPVFRSISSSRHADAITPTEPLGAVAVSPSGIGLPLNSGGSASATCLFEAGHRPKGGPAFTRVSACLFARSPKVTFTQSTSTHVVTSLRRSDCFRPSDRLAGWDSHPLEIADFHGVLVIWRVSLPNLRDGLATLFG